MTTKYINGSGLSKLLQLISNSVGQALSSISNRLSSNDKEHANLIYVSYDELYSMRNEYSLTPGQYYCITDYVTTTSQENTMAYRHMRSIIVLATDTNKLSEEAMTDDDCKVWYCLDNDTDRFAWAGATKSVLGFDYTMAFNDGNSTGRGTFKRDDSLIIEESDITYYGYTFESGSSITILNGNSVLWYTEEFPEFTDNYVPHIFYQILDGEMIPINLDSQFYESDEPIGKGVIYRMIDKNGNDCPYDFKSIMFKNPNDETDDKYYYTFYFKQGINIHDATFVSITKDNCYNNVIKQYKIDDKLYIPNNTFQLTGGSSYCYNNTLGNNCYNNTFDSDCYNNTFDSDCYNNTFGNNCYNNTFGNNCYNNTFGYGCNYNTFGSYYYNNTLDNNCHYNTFGIGCYNNTIGNKCTNNIFGNNCNYIQIINTSNNNVSYYNIASGTSGESYNPLIITGEPGRNFETKIARNSSGELKIYCEADLIA